MLNPATVPYRFGLFELDPAAGELRRQGVLVKLPPQPFKLLTLLVARPGAIVTRDEIRRELWSEDTFVDFEQGVNFSIRQVREALGDDAEAPRYVQTVPRRGYRFIAPVEPPKPDNRPTTRRLLTDVNLHKALWANIAEIRLAQERRHRLLKAMLGGVVALVVLSALVLLLARS
jgi:DNA-binding winged helix-turn-helix (wHTH) protein